MANKLKYMVEDTPYRRKQYRIMEMEVYAKQAQSIIKGLMEMSLSHFNVGLPTVTVMNNYRISRRAVAAILTNHFGTPYNFQNLVDFRLEIDGNTSSIVVRLMVLNHEEKTAWPHTLYLKKVIPIAGKLDPYKRKYRPRVSRGNGWTDPQP